MVSYNFNNILTEVVGVRGGGGCYMMLVSWIELKNNLKTFEKHAVPLIRNIE